MKRLGIIPAGLDRPLAFPIHIAELPSRLVAIRRHQREPVGERLGKGDAPWKFSGQGARFINEHPVPFQLNRRKPLGKLASLIVARLNGNVPRKIHVAQLAVLPDGNQSFGESDAVKNERLPRQESSRSID